jgi:hypothetical protein
VFAAIDVTLDPAGLGALFTSIGTLILLARNRNEIRAGNADIRDVNHAVNGKLPGAASIQSQVSDLHDERFPQPQEPEENGEAVLPTLRRIEALLAQLVSADE